MGGETVFKVVGHKCTWKKYRKFLWFELATVTSQELKYDVIVYAPYRFFKGVSGTQFGFLELKIGSLESTKIIIGFTGSEKIGSLQVHTGYLKFSLKKTCTIL